MFVRWSLFLCLSLSSLCNCGITDVSSLTQSLRNTKALQFLKELDLRDNMIGDSKQQLIDVIRDSNCELRWENITLILKRSSVTADMNKYILSNISERRSSDDHQALLQQRVIVSEWNVKLIKCWTQRRKENKSTPSQLYTTIPALLITSVIVNHFSLKTDLIRL